MNNQDAFHRNLRFCMDYRDLSSHEFAFCMDVHMEAHCIAWSKTLVSSQRKMRRILARVTEPKLTDMASFAYLLRVPTAVLVYGTIEELEAWLSCRGELLASHLPIYPDLEE